MGIGKVYGVCMCVCVWETSKDDWGTALEMWPLNIPHVCSCQLKIGFTLFLNKDSAFTSYF